MLYSFARSFHLLSRSSELCSFSLCSFIHVLGTMRCEISVSPSGPHAHSSWLDREEWEWLFIWISSFIVSLCALWSRGPSDTASDLYLHQKHFLFLHYFHFHTLRAEHWAFISIREIKTRQGRIHERRYVEDEKHLKPQKRCEMITTPESLYSF